MLYADAPSMKNAMAHTTFMAAYCSRFARKILVAASMRNARRNDAGAAKPGMRE